MVAVLGHVPIWIQNDVISAPLLVDSHHFQDVQRLICYSAKEVSSHGLYLSEKECSLLLLFSASALHFSSYVIAGLEICASSL